MLLLRLPLVRTRIGRFPGARGVENHYLELEAHYLELPAKEIKRWVVFLGHELREVATREQLARENISVVLEENPCPSG